MGKVINFPQRADAVQPAEGDGGDGSEIVVRIVVDCPDLCEDPEPELEPEPEPEPKSGRAGAFLWGMLIGWWLGG